MIFVGILVQQDCTDTVFYLFQNNLGSMLWSISCNSYDKMQQCKFLLRYKPKEKEGQNLGVSRHSQQLETGGVSIRGFSGDDMSGAVNKG